MSRSIETQYFGDISPKYHDSLIPRYEEVGGYNDVDTNEEMG